MCTVFSSESQKANSKNNKTGARIKKLISGKFPHIKTKKISTTKCFFCSHTHFANRFSHTERVNTLYL